MGLTWRGSQGTLQRGGHLIATLALFHLEPIAEHRDDAAWKPYVHRTLLVWARNSGHARLIADAERIPVGSNGNSDSPWLDSKLTKHEAAETDLDHGPTARVIERHFLRGF